MKLFCLFGAPEVGALRPLRPLTFGWLDDLFASGPLADRWPGLEMARARGGSLGNMPYLTTSVIVVQEDVGDSAVRILGPYGEWLPAVHEGVFFLVFNPLVVLDAVDEVNSMWLYEHNDPVNGKPICIMRPAFVEDRVTAPVFRPRGSRDMYLDGNTVEALIAAGYTGSEFIEIWDSETGVVRE